MSKKEFKETMKMLIQSNQNDIKSIEILDKLFASFAQYSHLIATVGVKENMITEADINAVYEECFDNAIKVNTLCEKCNIEVLFPDIKTMERYCVEIKYIFAFINEYVAKRIK